MKKIIAVLIAIVFPCFAFGATLSVSPSTQTINRGDIFTVYVNLDTQGKLIDGVDLRYLNFDPTMLEVQDENPSTSGVQISQGNLMPMTLANSVETNLGRIVFSQVVAGGNKYSGSGTLATIRFKTLNSGNTVISFNHSPQNTTDSNVASQGSDVLSTVINGNYSVVNTPSTSSGSNSGGGGGGGSSYIPANPSSPNPYNVSPIFSGSQIVRNLFKGAEGEDVKVLQNFLVSKGYMTSDNVTGFYGPVTENAVKRFQSDQGIVSSGTALTTGYGFVGPTTKNRINQLLSTGNFTVSTQLDQQKLTLLKLK